MNNASKFVSSIKDRTGLFKLDTSACVENDIVAVVKKEIEGHFLFFSDYSVASISGEIAQIITPSHTFALFTKGYELAEKLNE